MVQLMLVAGFVLLLYTASVCIRGIVASANEGSVGVLCSILAIVSLGCAITFGFGLFIFVRPDKDDGTNGPPDV